MLILITQSPMGTILSIEPVKECESLAFGQSLWRADKNKVECIAGPMWR